MYTSRRILNYSRRFGVERALLVQNLDSLTGTGTNLNPYVIFVHAAQLPCLNKVKSIGELVVYNILFYCPLASSSLHSNRKGGSVAREKQEHERCECRKRWKDGSPHAGADPFKWSCLCPAPARFHPLRRHPTRSSCAP